VLSRRRIQFLNFAVLTPGAHQSFKPVKLVGDFVESGNSSYFIGVYATSLSFRPIEAKVRSTSRPPDELDVSEHAGTAATTKSRASVFETTNHE
jgi:hypothetical protein